MTPEEHIKKIERCVLEADLTGMAESIGERHSQWDQISETMRSHILKLDAIFLTLLHARSHNKPP